MGSLRADEGESPDSVIWRIVSIGPFRNRAVTSALPPNELMQVAAAARARSKHSESDAAPIRLTTRGSGLAALGEAQLLGTATSHETSAWSVGMGSVARKIAVNTVKLRSEERRVGKEWK